MSATEDAPRRGILTRLPSVRAVVKACLFLQIGVGAAIGWETWVGMRDFGLNDSIETAPVDRPGPGDQRRPFSPGSLPARTGPQESPVPLPDSMPRRLSFAEHEVEGIGRVLLARGALDEGAAARFLGHLDSMEAPPDLVALHSPGGEVNQALEIGALIRERELNAGVLAQAACLSACPYALAGGVERVVSRAAWVGLHQHYYGKNSVLPMFMAVEGVQEGQGRTLQHLADMGVDPVVLALGLRTPPDEMYVLLPEELEEYRMATRLID